MAIDELILKYLRGELNLEEQHRISKRLKEEEVSPVVMDKIELFWKDPKNKYNVEFEEVRQEIYRKIADTNHKYQPSNEYVIRRSPVQRYLRIAALITLVAVMSFLLNDYRLDTPESPIVVANEFRKTMTGQKLQVHLRDGSQIKLNAESSIEFPKYFSDTSRIVTLKGEAYFEVAEDTLRPFQIIVGDVLVRALGTSFSIRNKSGTTTVFLTSGKVSVRSSKIGEATILTPGEMVTESSGFLSEVNGFSYSEVAWKDNVLIFEEASSSTVFQKLERWYGVDIHIEDDLGKWSFSGRFENEPLKEVLIGISHSEDFDFEIQNKEVVIKKTAMK